MSAIENEVTEIKSILVSDGEKAEIIFDSSNFSCAPFGYMVNNNIYKTNLNNLLKE